MRKPKLRRQRERGRPDRAFVRLGGMRCYVGIWGSEEARKEYRRLLAEYEATGGTLPVAPESITVTELVARFWAHATSYYGGRESSGELSNLKSAVRPLRELYGRTPAVEFGPRALKAVRQAYIDAGGCRSYVNKLTGKLKHLFKWAVAEELIPPSVYQALEAVSGLKRGRTTVRETPPVRPAPMAHIQAVKQHVSRQVAAIIELQLLTAARPGELLPMRAVDLDTSGRVWLYRPSTHKNEYRGHDRTIYLGPRAQAVIRPFLAGRPLDAPLFSPREAEEERLKARHADRKTPLHYGNRPGTNRKAKPRREPQDEYTTRSYNRAIERAAKAAKVPKWHPHQLRHNAATQLRKEFGLDAARTILGHRSPAITDLYAELDREKAVEIMNRIG